MPYSCQPPFRAGAVRAYARPMLTPLVGREPEEQRLDELLAAARGGEGAFVLVSGEAGVGKPRLASALARRADVTVLRGAAIQDRTAPYGPLVAALRTYL